MAQFDNDDDTLISQEDIDKLLNSPSLDGEDKTMDEDAMQLSSGPRFEPGLDQEIVIDESQAVSIEDNLVTQATIDRLLAEVPQSDPELEFKSEQVSSPEPGPPPSTFTGDDMDTIAQEDIDDLLRKDSPDDYSSGDFQEDDLISQDDIDELLKTSQEEDEDIIGDLDNDLYTTTDPEQEDDDHQVMLKKMDENLPPSAQASYDSQAPVDRRYRSRRLMVACLVVVMVLAALPMVYFGFLAEKKSELPSMTQVYEISRPGTSEVSTVQSDLVGENMVGENIAGENIAGENMTRGGSAQGDLAPGRGNFVLENFVLLVPNGKTGISYVTASLSIDYSDARAANEINDHLPLYRDIVFEAMNKVLVSQTIDKVTEADLLSNIKAELNLNLSGSYVEQVNFSAFSTG